MTPELQRKLEDAAIAAGIQLPLITQAKRYLRQLAPHAKEREGALLMSQLVLKLQDAERMAAAVDDMVRRSALDARSLLADARLDYGKPFSQSTVQEILSARPEALRSTVKTFDGEEPAILVAASWMLRNRGQQDHACKQCVPHSGCLIPGFRCYYHEAEALLSSVSPPL